MTAPIAELKREKWCNRAANRMPRKLRGIFILGPGLPRGHFALGASAGVAARCWPA